MKEPTIKINHAREIGLAQSFASHLTQVNGLSCYVEPPGNGLHHVFTLRINGRDWMGRKVLQMDSHQRWYLSSALKPSMLLGPHVQSCWSNDGVSLYVETASAAAKSAAFETALALPGSELHFPFALVDEAGKEALCPRDYWQCSDVLAERLSVDEQHFREYCAERLKRILPPGALIYDPACSTGAFIAHLAQALPDCHFLGTDRSASMIDFARRRHSASPVEFRQADAHDAARSGVRCDALLLRFLNAEVLTRNDAEQAFRALIPCVAPGGTIVIFGHTPVLIAVSWLAQAMGLHLESCIAARSGHTELFQCYQLTVCAP